VENLSECLCNDLVHHFYVTHCPSAQLSMQINVNGECDDIISSAARRSFINLPHMLAMFPENLILEMRENTVNAVNAVTGNVKSVYPNNAIYGKNFLRECSDNIVGCPERFRGFVFASYVELLSYRTLDSSRRPRLRLDFVFSSSSHSLGVPKPHFEVSRLSDVMTSRSFAATRFGSTKLKTHQQCERGQHPFTMPSLYAYLQLLVFLKSVACAEVVKQEETLDVEMDDIDSVLSESSFISSNNNLSSSCASDSLV
ncbi:hypothetical protein PFISCL1PPCAC_15472, partial [Pristionchus fissidentatus]